MKLPSLHTWPTERLSKSVLYLLIALTVVLFGAFYLVFYHLPYEENPSFNAPFFTGALIDYLIALIVLAIAVTVAASRHGLRHRDKSEQRSNGVAIGRWRTAITVATLLLLVFTFIAGSSAPLLVNGAPYQDTFWLKASDMFITTSVTMMAVAFAAIGLSWLRAYRQRR